MAMTNPPKRARRRLIHRVYTDFKAKQIEGIPDIERE
jgi:hypothetical protein